MTNYLPNEAEAAASTSTAPIKLRLLGSAHLEIDAAAAPPSLARKEFWLLALLALQQGRATGRDYLAGLLWPDCIEEQALYNLRRCLTRLRDALGDHADCLQSVRPRSLCFALDHAYVDVLEFDRLAADPERLEAALALYRGPLLPDCYEEWVLQERLPRELTYQRVLETLTAQAAARQDWREVERFSRLWVVAAPLQEQAHRSLMEALARSGSHAQATTVYRDLRLRLREEINTDPDPTTQALYETIREVARQTLLDRPRPGDAARPVAAPASPRSALPQPLTRLIGREGEREAVLAALTASRLVTLTAAGGVGKTRLAIETAQRCETQYADGATFLEFAAIGDPAFLMRQVAQALGIDEAPNIAPLDALTNALKDQERLLVLDNCEHLLTACARLTDALLRSCPKLRILATSRQPLGLMGEVVHRVPPLPTPPDPAELENSTPQKPDQSALLEYPSVQLFLDRVHQACPEFHFSPPDLPYLARICRRLDGIPLALELAAHRVRSLSLEKIAARLENRFQLLTGGNRAALPRQQTLRALIDWSYQLLDPQERLLFARLSVFVGGWTLETAEQVCGGEGIETWEMLDLMTSLTDRSLILYDVKQERYRCLETIHEYARERLQENEESEVIRRRHRDYFLARAESSGSHRILLPTAPWMEVEHENLLTAMDFCRETEDGAEAGLRLATSMTDFWRNYGYWKEGKRRIVEALAHPKVERTVAWQDARVQTATTDVELEECLAAYREMNDKVGMAMVMGALANIHISRGDLATARLYYEASLALHREQGNWQATPLPLAYLGWIAYKDADYETAWTLTEEAHQLDLKKGDQRGLVRLLRGFVRLKQGDLSAAHAIIHDCLTAYSTGNKAFLIWAIYSLAILAVEQGEQRMAACLLGAADRRASIFHVDLRPIVQELSDSITTLKAKMGEEAYTVAWEEGHGMAWEQAVAYALSEGAPPNLSDKPGF